MRKLQVRQIVGEIAIVNHRHLVTRVFPDNFIHKNLHFSGQRFALPVHPDLLRDRRAGGGLAAHIDILLIARIIACQLFTPRQHLLCPQTQRDQMRFNVIFVQAFSCRRTSAIAVFMQAKKLALWQRPECTLSGAK